MNQLSIIEKMSPAEIYGAANMEKVLGAIETEARSQKFDMTSNSGRKEIASVAYKIAQSKVFIDECGKKLGEDAKAKLDVINAERKKARDFLDGLKCEVRKPLDDWENTELKRIEDHESAITSIKRTGDLVAANYMTMSVETIHNFLNDVTSESKRDWQEFKDQADIEFNSTVTKLMKASEQAKARDAERAELEKLRAAAALQAQKDRDDKIAREAADKARLDAEKKAESERMRVELLAAEERLRVQREKKAADDKIAEMERDKERSEAKALAAAAAMEKEKQQAIEAERRKIAAEKQAETDAIAKREADQKHKTEVHNQISDALVENSGITEQQATVIILNIVSGRIPHTRIQY